MTSYNISRVVPTDESLKSVVETVVRANVEQKETFSAHDITVEVREILGQAVEVDHNKVRILVHAFMRDSTDFTYGAVDNGTYIEYQPMVVKGYNFVFNDGTPVLANKVAVQSVLGVPMPNWEHFKPDSTAIAHMCYEHNTNTLAISFTSGSGAYSFYNAPLYIWEGFKAADSKGRFFYKYIKGQYQEA